MHHLNYWGIALGLSATANLFLPDIPKPGSAPGFVSGPWYPVIYHGFVEVASLDFLKRLRGGVPNQPPPALNPEITLEAKP